MPPKPPTGNRPRRGRDNSSVGTEAVVTPSATNSNPRISQDSQPTNLLLKQVKTEATQENIITPSSSTSSSAAATGISSSIPRNGKQAGSIRGGRGLSRDAPTASATSRFKPKNVRRSANELAELAQKEKQKQADLAAENARQQARLMRGRGRARARGDAMGRGRGALGAASSIFGVVPESLKKASGVLSIRNEGGGGGGGFGMGGSSSGGTMGRFSVKNEGTSNAGPGGYSRNNGNGYHTYITPQYPGEDENAERIDIEQINLISDDEADFSYIGNQSAINKSGFLGKRSLKPVRLQREEHKSRDTIVNTDSKEPSASESTPNAIKSSPDSDDEGLFVSDDRQSNKTPIKDNDVSLSEKVVKKDSEDILFKPNIKTEPDTHEESDLSQGSIPEKTKNPTEYSLQFITKFDTNIDSYKTASLGEIPMLESAKSEPDSDKDTKQRILKHHPKPVMQTKEDLAEYERHIEDLTIIVNELGSLQQKSNFKSQDIDGDVNMEDSINPTENEDKKEGRLYLFQFPPVLPVLYNPLTEEKPGSKTDAKQEGDESGTFKIKSENKDQSNSSSNQNDKSKAKSSDGAPTVKIEDNLLEDGVEVLEDQKEDISGRGELVNEEGFIGKLVVRESGRVELCWGGTRLLVGRGIDVSFLTTGVVVDGVEKGPAGGGVPEGKAFGMGRIMGKFVVTPDWRSMIEKYD